jgi:hypothetical protein
MLNLAHDLCGLTYLACRAVHGDLGMLHPDDVVLALSHSGESEENHLLAGYDEDSAKSTGLLVEDGFRLMEMMMK